MPVAAPSKICSIETCDRMVQARGLCQAHYKRWHVKGNVEASRPIRTEPALTVVDGYAFIYKPEHPNAESNGRVRVHRLVMSEALARPLLPTETVHHRNGDTLDNRLENLELRIGAHPKGITVVDAIAYATEILTVHAPERLR